jgi:hypothetical protein
MRHEPGNGENHDGQSPAAGKLGRVIADLGKLGRELERMSNRFADLQDDVRQVADGHRPRKRLPRRLESDERDKLAARQGVRTFRMEWLKRNRARVQIDGKTLELSPRLAELLALLASNQLGDSDGAFVGWKSWAEIAQQMSPKSPQKKGTHTASQNICRLRQAMLESGINQYYVQSERVRGARLVLRRDHAAAI